VHLPVSKGACYGLLAVSERLPPAMPPSGGTASGDAVTGLGVAMVLVMLGAYRPARDQQRLRVRPRGRVGVDDPQVHPSNPARHRFLPGAVCSDRDLSGDICPQASPVIQQRDRPYLLGWVGEVPIQAHAQRSATACHGEVQHPTVETERAVIPAHRKYRAPTAREPGLAVTVPPTLGSGVSSIGVAAQHRPRASAVELPEAARPGIGQLTARLLIRAKRPILAGSPPGVQLQHARPHIPGRRQQADQATALPPGQSQPDPRSAVDRLRRILVTVSGHKTTPPSTDKTGRMDWRLPC
jgi:hypothetical protein